MPYSTFQEPQLMTRSDVWGELIVLNKALFVSLPLAYIGHRKVRVLTRWLLINVVEMWRKF